MVDPLVFLGEFKMTELEERYLAHHGILGQRWGRRNGPPYPLDASDHSAAEKKAGYKKSINSSKSEKSSDSVSREFHLTDKQKKYLKIGAAVAGTALVAYGGYRLASSPTVRNLAYKGLNKLTKSPSVEDMIKNSGPEIVKKPTIDKAGDIAKLKPDKTIFKKLPDNKIPKSVSDAFGNLDKNNPLKKADDVAENCTNVFLAADVRMRGFDVKPGFQKNTDGKFVGNKAIDIYNCYVEKVDSNGNSPFKQSKGSLCKSYESVKNVLDRNKYPDGSRGYIDGVFKFGDSEYKHAMMWEKLNGEYVFGDGVNGLKAKSYFNNISDISDVQYFRCDNLELIMDKASKFFI